MNGTIERWQRSLLCGLALSLVVGLLSGCTTPLCHNARLQTKERALRGLWNSLQRINNQRSLEVWVSRFLDHLLAGTSYQLKEESGRFIVVARNDNDQLCRVNVTTQQKQIRDPKFLSRLLTLKNQYRLKMRTYLYTPPKETTSEGTSSSISGGNCESKNYQVEMTYWKSISTKYSQKYWKEACKIGKKLKKWEVCFKAPLQALFRKRMKMICQ